MVMVFTRGDFNSKIGIWNDFTTENKKNLNYLPQGYEVDTIQSVRNNQNTSVNEYTHDLFNVCPETRLRILNCRICGDLHGHLTYVDFHGCSRIILVLTSEASDKVCYSMCISVNDLSIFQHLTNPS